MITFESEMALVRQRYRIAYRGLSVIIPDRLGVSRTASPLGFGRLRLAFALPSRRMTADDQDEADR